MALAPEEGETSPFGIGSSSENFHALASRVKGSSFSRFAPRGHGGITAPATNTPKHSPQSGVASKLKSSAGSASSKMITIGFAFLRDDGKVGDQEDIDHVLVNVSPGTTTSADIVEAAERRLPRLKNDFGAFTLMTTRGVELTDEDVQCDGFWQTNRQVKVTPKRAFKKHQEDLLAKAAGAASTKLSHGKGKGKSQSRAISPSRTAPPPKIRRQAISKKPSTSWSIVSSGDSSDKLPIIDLGERSDKPKERKTSEVGLSNAEARLIDMQATLDNVQETVSEIQKTISCKSSLAADIFTKLQEQATCPVCSFVLKQPILTNCCNNAVCCKCAETWNSSSSTPPDHCPICGSRAYDQYLCFNMKGVSELFDTIKILSR